MKWWNDQLLRWFDVIIILESFCFPHSFAIGKEIQAVSLNMLIIHEKINNFKFYCAPIDFIEEMPFLGAIFCNRTFVSVKNRSFVRKRPLEALTDKASRGYCVN